MKRKAFIYFLFGLSCLFSFSYLYKIFRSNMNAVQDYTPTTLVQKNTLPKKLVSEKLLSRKTVMLEFRASYDNLGIIAVRFDKPLVYEDLISFRLKEKNSDMWYYTDAVQAHKFNTAVYYTFGFPPIGDSKNRNFIIELESEAGTDTSSVSLHRSSDVFLAKYSYPKNLLLQNKNIRLPFLRERVLIYASYIPISAVAYALFLFLLPFILAVSFRCFWQISKRLEKSDRFYAIVKYIAPIILFLTTVIIYGLLSSIGADAHHDGAIFKPAMDVASGLMLYRDTFFFYGALTTLIQACALLVFGKYLLTLKLLTVFFYGCNVLLGYAIARKFLPILISFFISLIWIFMAPYFFYITYNWTTVWSSAYAIFFQLLTSYLIVKLLETKQTRFIFLSGITTALAFWCRQTVGIFLFFAVSFFFIMLFYTKNISKKQLKRTLISYALAVAGASSIFLFWIISNQALNDWWRQSILRVYVWGQDNGNGYAFIGILKALFAPSKSILSVWTLIPASTIILAIRSFSKLRKKRDAQSKIVFALTLIGLSSWSQYFPYNDPAHAFWAATPMFSLFALFSYQLIKEYICSDIRIPSLTLKYAVVVLILVIFLPDLSYRMHDAVQKMKEPYDTVWEPSVLRNIKLTKEEKEWYTYVYNHIQEYFKKYPNGNVITNSPDSLYLTFDPRIKNYQPVYMNWWMDKVYPEYETNKDAYLKNNHPFLISYYDFLPKGYCRVDSRVQRDTTFLATPCPPLTAE